MGNTIVVATGEKEHKKRMSKSRTEVLAITHSPLSSAVRTGLEPATPGVTGLYSNRLNYRTKFFESFKAALLPFCGAKLRRYFGLCKFLEKFFQNIFSNLRAFLINTKSVNEITILPTIYFIFKKMRTRKLYGGFQLPTAEARGFDLASMPRPKSA